MSRPEVSNVENTTFVVPGLVVVLLFSVNFHCNDNCADKTMLLPQEGTV